MTRNSKQSDAENVKSRQEKQELEERIRFEKLLCTLSATFVNLPSDAIDGGNEHGLELIVRFLGADRGVVFQFSEDGRTLKVTYSYIAPSGKPLPSTTITEGQRHLWYTETLRNGEMVVLENLPDDLPKEAFAESSAPPMKLVKIGPDGDACVQIGLETVMFRHEEKFRNPPGLAVKIAADLGDDAAKARLDQINKAVFTRI